MDWGQSSDHPLMEIKRLQKGFFACLEPEQETLGSSWEINTKGRWGLGRLRWVCSGWFRVTEKNILREFTNWLKKKKNNITLKTPHDNRIKFWRRNIYRCVIGWYFSEPTFRLFCVFQAFYNKHVSLLYSKKKVIINKTLKYYLRRKGTVYCSPFHLQCQGYTLESP